MKSKLFLTISLGVALLLNACDPAGKPVTELNTINDTVSYVIGLSMAENLKQIDTIIDEATLIQGLKDKLNDGEILLNEEEGRMAMDIFFKKMQDDQMKQQFATNISEAESFFAQNKTKAGVVSTESGLQYEIIAEGTGKKPTMTDKVKVHYHGTLLNGTVFDSSVERGEPVEFPVTGVIQGWTEALMLMTEGAKWKLFVPSNLGYGANPRPGGPIEPYQALVFEVELIEIVN